MPVNLMNGLSRLSVCHSHTEYECECWFGSDYSDLVSVVCGKVINFDILMICSTKRSLHIKFRLVRVVVIVVCCNCFSVRLNGKSAFAL